MDIQQEATNIVKKLVESGYVAYFAGGWVRDYLMGHPSADIDIATNATPDAVQALFPKTIPVGAAFGVIIVLVNGHQFEVSTFRKDIESHGRRPEKIVHCTAEEDAERRDFTINGLFYDPLTKEIHDFVNGKEDIKRNVIQTIGNPSERFYEDRLRMIRAFRFAARFGFAIDPATEEAIAKNAHTLFPHVAIERVFQEFAKMAEYPHMDKALIDMHRLGLLQVIFSHLKQTSSAQMKELIAALPYFPADCPPILHLMELFPDLPLEQQLDICRYLKVGNDSFRIVEFVCNSKALLKQAKEEEIPLTAWTHFYAHPHSQLCLDIIAAHHKGEEHTSFLQEHSERMEKLHPHSRRIAEKTPLITGAILQSHGIKPGKEMGLLLKEAEYLAITHDLHDSDAVMKLLIKSPNWPQS